jgi:hypothetical protein
VVYFATDPAGEELTLRFADPAAVEVGVFQVEGPGRTPELLELQRRLPNWTSVKAFAMHVVKTRI